MTKLGWLKVLEKVTDGKPLISKRKIKEIGIGSATVDKAVDGLSKINNQYFIEDVAEGLMRIKQ